MKNNEDRSAFAAFDHHRKYAGGNPVKDKGADCSGSVWAIYKEAGLSYGTYQSTATFPTLVGIDANFVKGTHFFKKVDMKVDTPQVGDVGWWNGHMVIYDLNAGKTDKQLAGNVWSASSPTSSRKFGPGKIDWYIDEYDAPAVSDR